MNDIENMLWRRNKELMDEHTMLVRQLAKVLVSTNHQEAVEASKLAFATLDLNSPFAPDDVVHAPEKERDVA